MIEIIREFIVKEEARGQFELSYGPGGSWSRLVAGGLGFRGTTLLQDIRDLNRYLVIDMWDTLELREQSLSKQEAEYSKLEATFAGWTESMAELGFFRALAEATVKPRSRARRTRNGGAGRRKR